jgi:hypothetical protein
MFKIFTEEAVPKSAFEMMYARANPDSVSKLIRACRWLFWAAMFASIALIVIHGTSRAENRFARLEWICFFVFNTGNFALYHVERRRQKKKEAEAL